MSAIESAIGFGGRFVPGSSGRLLVLIFHRVHAEPDPMFPREITAETFEWQMDVIKRHLNPLPLEDAIGRWQRQEIPDRAVAVTFDDGYADNFTVALPILKEYSIPATFFVSTGYLNGGRMWNDTIIESVRRLPNGTLRLEAAGIEADVVSDADRRRLLCNEIIARVKHLEQSARQAVADELASLCETALPDDLMMVDEQVRGLVSSGMSVGGHTVTHPILKTLDPGSAAAEIRRGKEELEAVVGMPVSLFAYPNGKPGTDFGPEHARSVEDAGFAAAFSTTRGVISASSDRWQLPRFTPWDRSRNRFLARMLLEYRNAA
jgi:peptidoglycan/xylan/chitin deacetylase (PgdA/CDA1 family)